MLKKFVNVFLNLTGSWSLDNRLTRIEERLDSIDNRLTSIDDRIRSQIRSTVQWGILTASLAVLAIMLTVGYDLPERNLILFFASFGFTTTVLMRYMSFSRMVTTMLLAFAIEAILLVTIFQDRPVKQSNIGFIFLGLWVSVNILWPVTQFALRKARGGIEVSP